MHRVAKKPDQADEVIRRDSFEVVAAGSERRERRRARRSECLRSHCAEIWCHCLAETNFRRDLGHITEQGSSQCAPLCVRVCETHSEVPRSSKNHPNSGAQLASLLLSLTRSSLQGGITGIRGESGGRIKCRIFCNKKNDPRNIAWQPKFPRIILYLIDPPNL